MPRRMGRRPPRILLTAAIWVSLVLCTGTLLSVIPPVAGAFGGLNRATASGRRTIPEARQFDELFPGATHSISYYTGTAGEPTWNAEVGLHGRYVLTMSVPVTLSTFGRSRVIGHRAPAFVLAEVEAVGQLADGRTEIRYAGHQLRFGPAEWQRVVAARGDWGVLGFAVRTDAPVPGFDTVWQRK